MLHKCPICQEGGLSYRKFLSHKNCCTLANKYGMIQELKKLEKEKEEEIAKLKLDIEQLKNNNYELKIVNPQNELRKELITDKLDVDSKNILYQQIVDGNFNYYWTPLHYAMHFGKMEIAFYILVLLIKQGKYNMAMKLQSNDGRTPVLCLLKSSELSLSDKKEYFTRLVQRYKIFCDDITFEEIKDRDLEEIYKNYQNKFNN